MCWKQYKVYVIISIYRNVLVWHGQDYNTVVDINPNLHINPTNSRHGSMSQAHKFKWDVTFPLSATCHVTPGSCHYLRFNMVWSLSHNECQLSIGQTNCILDICKLTQYRNCFWASVVCVHWLKVATTQFCIFSLFKDKTFRVLT